MRTIDIPLSARVRHLIDREGLASFLLSAPYYFRLKIRTSHLYRVFARSTEGAVIPEMPAGTECRIVRDIEELDRLIASPFHISYLNTRYVREALRREVVLVCLFTNGTIAHTTWVATGASAALDPFAENVDYRYSAYICDCYTRPRFRGRGLYPLALRTTATVTGEMGFTNNLLVVQQTNLPSLLAVKHAGYAECGELVLRRAFGTSRSVLCSLPSLWHQ